MEQMFEKVGALATHALLHAAPQAWLNPENCFGIWLRSCYVRRGAIQSCYPRKIKNSTR